MDNEYANIAKLRPPIHVADLGRECLGLQTIIGSDNFVYSNLHIIEHSVILYVTGNSIVFHNTLNDSKTYLMGIDEGGIGCVAVHPSRKYLAVGGKGSFPNIYIYSYPSLQIQKILRGGAEKGYSTMSFNKTGQKLASVATAPDFMLTIWDWEEEKMGLHAKAFGQDIFTVKFSLDDDYRLVTSGIGHIRFWKIASTFTGLKLQGLTGKFGKVELSDILSFVELPDGKVVSGTEYGSLLLWEGNFIKCKFVRPDGKPCHDGEITYIHYDRNEKTIVSSGNDGYLRMWNFETIETAEIDSDHSMNFYIEPLVEFNIGKGSGIVSIVDSGSIHYNRFIVYKNRNGLVKSLKFDLRCKGSEMSSPLKDVLTSLTTNDAENSDTQAVKSYYHDPVESIVIRGHSGYITGLDTCPCGNYAASCDSAGQIHLWDYTRNKLITSRRFNDSISTTLAWLPKYSSGAAIGASFGVGFHDGVVRLLSICQHPTNGIVLVLNMTMKPHDSAITCLSFSPRERNAVATAARDGTVFLFECSTGRRDKESIVWKPIRFFSIFKGSQADGTQKKDIYAKNISWSGDGLTLLCSCNDNILREVSVKDILDLKGKNDIETYEISVPVRELLLKTQDPSQQQGVATAHSSSMDGGTALASSMARQPSIVVRKPSMDVNSRKISMDSRKPSMEKSGRSSTANVDIVAVHTAPSLSLQSHNGIYSLNRRAGGVITCSSYENGGYHLHESSTAFEILSEELFYGSFVNNDAKESIKSPIINTMRYSWSGRLLAQGADDGSVIIRPSLYLETYARSICHTAVKVSSIINNEILSGTAVVAVSHDDKYILTGGYDGTIVIQRLRLDIILSDQPLSLAKDIEANVFDSMSKHPCNQSLNYQEPSYLHIIKPDESCEKQFPTYIISDDLESNEDENQQASKLIVSLALHDISKDIQSSTTKSIEQEKLSRNEDIRLLATNELKDNVRQYVKELRQKYNYLKLQNNSLPNTIRLSNESFLSLDEDYWNELLKQKQNRIEEIHKECAYEMERALVLRSKIMKRYLDNVIIEEMTLYAFPLGLNVDSSDPRNTKLPCVLSLRTKKLDDNVIDIINSIRSQERQRITDKQNSSVQSELVINEVDIQETDHQTILNGIIHLTNTLQGKTIKSNDNNNHSSNGLQSASTDMIKPNINTMVIRRDLRKQRLENIKLHDNKRPKENEDDIRDIQAIQHAEKTLGNYQLKYSDDYDINDSNCINAMKKKHQMALLEEKIYSMKLDFNEKFLNLRKLKYETIINVQKSNNRIKNINNLLNMDELNKNIWEPNHNPMEYPDDRDEITMSELQQYRLYRGIRSDDELPDKMNKNQVPMEKVPNISHSVVTGNKTTIEKDSFGHYSLINNQSHQNHTIDIRNHSVLIHSLNETLSNTTNVDAISHDGNIKKKEYYEVDDRLFKDFYHRNAMEYQSQTYKLSKGNSGSISNLSQYESILPQYQLIKSMKLKQFQSKSSNEIVSNNPRRQSSDVAIYQQYKKQLLYERNTLMNMIQKDMKVFNNNLNDLILQRHEVIHRIKLYELQLLTLYHEYQLLLTYEDRDNTLQSKLNYYNTELSDIQVNMNDIKDKLDIKQDEYNQHQNKLGLIINELKNILPENHVCYDILNKIFKKKIKRSKQTNKIVTSDNDNVNKDDNELDDNYDDAYDDEDDNYNDDDEYDDIEDVCPVGCETILYEKIIDLRDKRLNIDDIMSDVNKVIEEYKKTLDRYKQREKQILKDVQQSALELRQFQLQKQAALNQIDIIVPVKLSQIYAFEGSGIYSKPYDMLSSFQRNAMNLIENNGHNRGGLRGHANTILNDEVAAQSPEDIANDKIKESLRDPLQRRLVSSIDTKTHVFFNKDALLRLDERIRELHEEYDQAQKSLKDLYKERIRLKKDKESKQQEIIILENKCKELQMLKFGRIIQLDDLEIGTDRTKEEEIESQIKLMESEYHREHSSLMKDIEQLQEKLAEATLKNTECLRKVAELAEEKLVLTRSLNHTTPSLAEELLPTDDVKDLEERQRLAAYIRAQQIEIRSLQSEITVLKRKDIPPAALSKSLPVPPSNHSVENLKLPPIRDAKESV